MGIELEYRKILENILIRGQDREDRTGVGSYSIFNASLSWSLYTHKFPLITGRKMFPKTFLTEFEWFIHGETNIQRFKDAGVKIWDNWADENGDLGPVYGHQMRNFNSQSIDQLEAVIHSLKHNPDSRRHIISLWNPAEQAQMALPPCYLYFQFFVEEIEGSKVLRMFVVQRSGDVYLGIPYDVALFSQILLYIADEVNLIAGDIQLQIVDAHIYKNQIDAVSKYLKTEIFPLPTFTYDNKTLKIENYQHGPIISAPIAV